MAWEAVELPSDFLNSFGFHDVCIERIHLDFDQQSAELVTPDLNFNYEGSAGYVARPCRLRFEGVTLHKLNILDVEGVRITHITGEIVDGGFQISVYLNLGSGRDTWESKSSSISFAFKSLALLDL